MPTSAAGATYLKAELAGQLSHALGPALPAVLQVLNAPPVPQWQLGSPGPAEPAQEPEAADG
jgi:hypothetical protein